MRFTNKMMQQSLDAAYHLLESPQGPDMTAAVKTCAPDIARYMAELEARDFLERMPEDDLEAAIAIWNAPENTWLRQYIIARMAEAGLHADIGRLPLGVNGMEIDP